MPQDSTAAPVDSVTMRDQVGVVSRRWRIIAAFTILGVAASAFFLHRESRPYVSHAQVQVSAPTDDPFAPTKTATSTSVVMPTEEKVATSATVADLVARKLNSGQTGQELLRRLTVTVPATTQILDFAFSAGSPAAAQAGARTFANAYMSNRRAMNAAQIVPQEKKLTSQIATLARRRDALSKQVSTTDPGANAELDAQITQLNQQITSTQQSLTLLQGIDQTAATVTQSATLPTFRSGKSVRTVGAAGLVAGLVLGLIAAFAREALDDHLRGPGDLYAAVGVPVLARIPQLRHLPWRRLDLAAEGTSHPKVAEAYRHLASRLLVLGVGGPVRSILISSPAEADGRSSVAANLAAVYVELGYRVWLVSADLAPPQVHTLLAPAGPSNLVSILPITARESAATKELERHPDPDIEGHGHLTLMSGTGQAHTTGRLLHPLHLGRQIVHNQQHVDITIIDAPPMLDFADAIPLIPVVDGVVVVADAGTTKRAELVELVELLDNSKASIIGSILNRDGSRVVSRRARRARRRIERLLRPEPPPAGVFDPSGGPSRAERTRSAAGGRSGTDPESDRQRESGRSWVPEGTLRSHTGGKLSGWPGADDSLAQD